MSTAPLMLEGWTYPQPFAAYRYELGRVWDRSKPRGVIIGLNPSKATHDEPDHTITKEIHFAQEWGWGGFVKLNLFAFAATHPKDLWAAFDPVGPENDERIAASTKVRVDAQFVAAWGAFKHPRAQRRVQAVLCGPLRDVPLFSIGPPTKHGAPSHPLMLKYGLALQRWGPS